MTLKTSYKTRQDANADLLEHGFVPRNADASTGIWSKPSTLHDGRPTVAIVRVTEQRVAPEYGQPNYFTADFL